MATTTPVATVVAIATEPVVGTPPTGTAALPTGRVAVVGDAAHTVPPTAAKGMNLAIADASDFDRRRQLGELRTVASSAAGHNYLAEGYTGWPLPVG